MVRDEGHNRHSHNLNMLWNQRCGKLKMKHTYTHPVPKMLKSSVFDKKKMMHFVGGVSQKFYLFLFKKTNIDF